MDSTTKTTFGQKVADNVTKFIGSWAFLIAMNLFIFSWVIINLYVVKIDVFPFTLLNLMLSWIAGVQAPLIMISQNRQEEIPAYHKQVVSRRGKSLKIMSNQARPLNKGGGVLGMKYLK